METIEEVDAVVEKNLTKSKLKINKRAFELGSACRRAGLSKERMLDYYKHEMNNPDYNQHDMVDGWDHQDEQYREHEGDRP
jgi:hypothetical protein